MADTILNQAARAAEAGGDPNEAIEKAQGAYTTDGAENLSEAEAWGTEQNPVSDVPLAAKNLTNAGK